MKNDLKSSEALKAYAREVLCGNNPTNSLLIRMFDEIIDNAPPAEPEKVLIANVTFDEDKLKEIVQTEVIDKIKSGELVLKDEWVRKEDIIHLLERWADGYSYIEIPTDTAIKAIKEMGGGAE